MPLKGIVEIPSLQAKRGFVMPAQAGIHLCSFLPGQKHLDSGPGSGPGQALRRNYGRNSRLPVDKFRTHRLIAEGCSVTLLARFGDDAEFVR